LKAGAVSGLSSLEEISIRSLGVIDSSSLELGSGFTVLSGETGAGKTMILTAIGLIMGAKSDSDFVRKGSERLSVSARFAIADSAVELHSLLKEVGAEIEDGSVLISRTVTNQGKSRITIGGAQVTATQATQVSELLLEVHAQSSSARLNKPSHQRDIVDSFGALENFLSDYQSQLAQYNELVKRIADLERRLLERDREMAEIKEFVTAFEKVKPELGELDEIENEISRLGSVESINANVTAALGFLSDEELSALNLLQSARKSLEPLRGKDGELDPIVERFVDALFSVEESAGDLGRYLSGLEANPVRFEHLQVRKSVISLLIKKFGKGSDRAEAYRGLIVDAQEATQRLKDLAGGDSRLEELRAEQSKQFISLRDSGLALSGARATTATTIGEAVTNELRGLSMPHAELSVRVFQSDPERIASFGSHGLDEIRFDFSSHAGQDPLPITKAASGGELSRIMLAIEVVLAEKTPVGTYIFDEVDAGVGGKTAVEVGRRLAKLAERAQVLVVTHLPQVAAWANHHFVVAKTESGDVTESHVRKVVGEDRIVEIARLLSGQDESELARKHAEELFDLVKDSTGKGAKKVAK
jgi:DNA repair protein RecN (Recombination protein N)